MTCWLTEWSRVVRKMLTGMLTGFEKSARNFHRNGEGESGPSFDTEGEAHLSQISLTKVAKRGSILPHHFCENFGDFFENP